MFWVAGDAAEGWEKKIQVVDPDPVSIFEAYLASTNAKSYLFAASYDLDSVGWLGRQFSCGRPE